MLLYPELEARGAAIQVEKQPDGAIRLLIRCGGYLIRTDGLPLPTEDRVRTALRDVIDPELGFNIVDLGLVYQVAIDRRIVAVAQPHASSLGCFTRETGVTHA